MKPRHVLDIIFGMVILPGMMLLFPLAEWLQWHPAYVLIYAGWLYLVYFLCRKGLGPQLTQGWKGIATVLGILFLVGVVTFLMTLTSVEFPRTVEPGAGMELHVRAMWLLLLAVVSAGLPMGMLSREVRDLDTRVAMEEAVYDARSALENRAREALGDLSIQVKQGYQTVHIPLAAIQYLESRNNYVCFHLEHRPDVVTQVTMKEVMTLLPEGKFVRIHRSYTVPVWRIEKRTATSVQLMGLPNPLPVGRAHKDNLLNG